MPSLFRKEKITIFKKKNCMQYITSNNKYLKFLLANKDKDVST